MILNNLKIIIENFITEYPLTTFVMLFVINFVCALKINIKLNCATNKQKDMGNTTDSIVKFHHKKS